MDLHHHYTWFAKLDLTITKPLVKFPCCLFFSTTLVSLSLIGNILLNPPSASRFPNLRILVLRYAEYANSESLPTLLTACPVLILEVPSTSSFCLHDRLFKMNKVIFHEFMIAIEDKVQKVNVTNCINKLVTKFKK